MRQALLLALLCAAASAQERAFIEVETARTTYYVNESVDVTLRFGIDLKFLQESMVQMFAQPLDVPVQVEAPWLEKMRRIEVPGGSTVALNDEPVGAEREEAGSYRIDFVHVVREPGELKLSARLKYAWGTRFKEDFVHGRTALDRRDAHVDAKTVVIEVRALPKEGQPTDFTGAVGEYQVEAFADPVRLDAGAVLKLWLHVKGGPNLDLFEPPRLSLDGFHTYGSLESFGDGVRTFTYELAPLSGDVKEIPAIEFWYFDPRAGEYRAARTKAIPLEVKAKEATAPPPPPPGTGHWWMIAPVAVAVLFVFLLLRRKPDPVPDAAATFRTRAAEDVAGAFTEYLAARLACPTASVISPDLKDRLQSAGVSADLAAETARLVEELVGARYGGHAADGTTITAFVDELEGVFTSPAPAASRRAGR